MKKTLLPFVAVPLFLLVTCRPGKEKAGPSAGAAQMQAPIYIGDDFLSGYQDGAFTREGQDRSVAALLQRQLRELTDGTIIPPEIHGYLPEGVSIGWNLKPWESWYNTASKLGDRTDCEGVTSMGPVKQAVSVSDAQSRLVQYSGITYNNFTVPFTTTADWFDPALATNPFADNHNPFYFPIARPGTATLAQEVREANSSFFTMWLGMENIYSWARRGGTGAPMITAAEFSDHLDSLLLPMIMNGEKGVIANIPGFRTFPYYTLIPWDGAELTQSKADSLNDIYTVSGLTHIQFHAGDNGFVIDDASAPMNVRQLHAGEYITLSIPLDSMKCNYMGILFATLPDRYVLDSSEVAEVDAMIAAYNQVIAQKAAQYDLGLVDMHSYFLQVESGVRWDGVDYNATFVSGGFFSLDGYHPHQKGYALITNEFIKAINKRFTATVPTLNCFECDGVLFP